jgi:hypothetical protein
MAKPARVDDSVKIAFKALRHNGLIPKEWKISELTDYKKRKIRTISKQFAKVIEKPSNFSMRTIGEKSAKALMSSGYKAIKTGRNKYRIALPARGVEKQSIENGKLTIYRLRRKEEIFFTGGLDTLKQLSESLDKEPLKENQYWTLKVGDKMSFISAPFKSVQETAEFYTYALTDSGRPADILTNVQLVRVTLPPDDPVYAGVPPEDLAKY